MRVPTKMRVCSILLLLPLAGAFHSRSPRATSTSRIHRSPRKLVPKAVVIDPSYNLAVGAGGIGGLFGFKTAIARGFIKDLPPLKIKDWAPSAVFLFFAAFLTFQTTNLRFTIDDDNFALVSSSTGQSGENIVVGGSNRWKLSTITNYALLPNDDFPILVYFKETQTPADAMVDAPIVVDDAPGQAHFFPAIARTSQIIEGFKARGVTKL